MRKPKIIFLYVNVEKEIKKQDKREIKRTLLKMERNMKALVNSDNKTFDETIQYIRNSIEGMTDKEMKTLYSQYSKGVKSYNKNYQNEVAISMDDVCNEFCVIENSSLEENKKVKTTRETFLHICNKTEKLFNKKGFKIAMGFAVALFFGVLALAIRYDNTLAVATIAPLTEIPGKIKEAYNYIKTIGFVVAFVFLSLELLQKGIHGDTRAMGMILAKYVMFAVALLSFKSIYDMIDAFFNG